MIPYTSDHAQAFHDGRMFRPVRSRQKALDNKTPNPNVLVVQRVITTPLKMLRSSWIVTKWRIQACSESISD